MTSLTVLSSCGEKSIRLLRVGLLAGLHQFEAVFELAQQGSEVAALLRRETRQDLLFAPQQPRKQFLVKRAALARQAQAEFAAIVGVFDPLDDLRLHQRRHRAADGRFVGARALRDVLRAAGFLAETERRQHAPARDIETMALPIFDGERVGDLGGQPVEAERHEFEQIEACILFQDRLARPGIRLAQCGLWQNRSDLS